MKLCYNCISYITLILINKHNTPYIRIPSKQQKKVKKIKTPRCSIIDHLFLYYKNKLAGIAVDQTVPGWQVLQCYIDKSIPHLLHLYNRNMCSETIHHSELCLRSYTYVLKSWYEEGFEGHHDPGLNKIIKLATIPICMKLISKQ